MTVSGSGTGSDPFVITLGGCTIHRPPGDGTGIGGLNNTAPVLNGANELGALSENGTNLGSLVSSLITGQAVDADGNSLGIAVTAVDDSHGTWQYTTDGGTTWRAFAAPSGRAALLLAGDADTRVRFLPAQNWTGQSSITFRAWDQTQGTPGNTMDTSDNGGIRCLQCSHSHGHDYGRAVECHRRDDGTAGRVGGVADPVHAAARRSPDDVEFDATQRADAPVRRTE